MITATPSLPEDQYTLGSRLFVLHGLADNDDKNQQFLKDVNPALIQIAGSIEYIVENQIRNVADILSRSHARIHNLSDEAALNLYKSICQRYSVSV